MMLLRRLVRVLAAHPYPFSVLPEQEGCGASKRYTHACEDGVSLPVAELIVHWGGEKREAEPSEGAQT